MHPNNNVGASLHPGPVTMPSSASGVQKAEIPREFERLMIAVDRVRSAFETLAMKLKPIHASSPEVDHKESDGPVSPCSTDIGKGLRNESDKLNVLMRDVVSFTSEIHL